MSALSTLAGRWSAFSPRERLLIGVAGALLVVLLLSVLVFRPLANARANGMAAFEEAAITRAAVARAAGSGSTANGPAPDLRAVAQTSADAFGIVVDRYDFQDDAVDLTVSDVDAPTLYAWLTTLEEEGIAVREAQLRAGDDGLVTARLTLAGG